MVKGRHEPPSRRRYEESHPVVSIRVDKQTAETLRKLASITGKSLATLIRECLMIQERKELTTYQLGYEKGAKDHQILFPCARCGKPTVLVPGSEAAKVVIQCLQERGWGHRTCPR